MIIHGVINELERRPALEEGIQNMNETETKELIKIFQQFGIYRNSLSKEHDDFVKQQLQKNYDIVTKIYELQGKIYTGTFRENPHRKENKVAYEKEAKLATVLASMGFDVVLIEEDNTKEGTKPDAIVNGIVMDFKEIEAFYEHDTSKNSLGRNYRDGMRKEKSEGVVIYLHNFSNEYTSEHMKFEQTRRGNNGLALFFHEDTGALQLIDMEIIRAAHFEQLSSRKAPDVSAEPLDKLSIASLNKKSNENISLTKPITIVVNQYDEQHNPVMDKNGNVVKATLHCNKGIGVAFGTLVHKTAVLERDNELLRKQLNMYQKKDSISPSDDEIER